MNSKLGDTVAHWLYVAEKTSLKPLDPSDHNTTNRGVRQLAEPSGELRERFDAEHVRNVIERLRIVKPALLDRSERKVRSRFFAGARSFVAPNRPVVSTHSWPDAGAPTIDFIATLPTVNLHLQRQLPSRRIEKSYDRLLEPVSRPRSRPSKLNVGYRESCGPGLPAIAVVRPTVTERQVSPGPVNESPRLRAAIWIAGW